MLQGRALGPVGNQGHTFSSASCLFQDPTWQMQLIRAQLRQSQYNMVFTGSEVAVAPLLLTLGFWEASLLREEARFCGTVLQSLLQSQQLICCFHLVFHPVAAETKSFSSSELNPISHPVLYSCGRQI